MSDQQKPKKKPAGIAAAIVDGAKAAKNPRYALYRREAEAMGEKVMTAEEWARRNGK